MKCDAEDIKIDKFRNAAGLPIDQKEIGEYTYRINFKYQKDREIY